MLSTSIVRQTSFVLFALLLLIWLYRSRLQEAPGREASLILWTFLEDHRPYNFALWETQKKLWKNHEDFVELVVLSFSPGACKLISKMNLSITCFQTRCPEKTLSCLSSELSSLGPSKAFIFSDPGVLFSEEVLVASQFLSSNFENYIGVGGSPVVDLVEGRYLTSPPLNSTFNFFLHGPSLSPFEINVSSDGHWKAPFLEQARLLFKQLPLVDTSGAFSSIFLSPIVQARNDQTQLRQELEEPPSFSWSFPNASFTLKKGEQFLECLRFTPFCTNLTFSPLRDDLQFLLELYSVDQKIVVAFFDEETSLELAMNFVCFLRKIRIGHYLIHTKNHDHYQALSRLGMNAYYEPVVTRTGSSMAEDYRTSFVMKIISTSRTVFVSSLHAVFLRNPFNNLPPAFEIHVALREEGHLIKDTYAIFPSEKVLSHLDLVSTIINQGINGLKIVPLRNMIRSARFNLSLWSEGYVASSERFFHLRQTQNNGEWPIQIQTFSNPPASPPSPPSSQSALLQKHSLLLVENDLSCRKFPESLSLPVQKDFYLLIKILAYDRPSSLGRLLNSLRAAYIDDPIDLDIFIDFPSESGLSDYESLASRKEVIKMARNFQWTHGRKRVIPREKHHGLPNQWFNAWFPQAPNELCLFLEDDNMVSPHFYFWAKKAIRHYFLSQENYNPNLFGIMLQHQNVIVGNPKKRPSALLPPNSLFYRFQMLGMWGPIFFPHHWSQFLMWKFQKERDPNFRPIISNLSTNKWILEEGGIKRVWSSWFARYSAERGLFALYTNFPGEKGFVVNFRDKGVHFALNAGPNARMVEEIEPYMLEFPALQNTTLHDFHFNRINDAEILVGRGLYSDSYNIPT